MPEPFTSRIKICGITSLTDAVACTASGAEAIGFNFYPRSSRYVATEWALETAVALRRSPPTVQLVGVFVNRRPADINEIAATVGLDWIQLHGDEPREFAAEIGPQRVIRAVRVRGDDFAAASHEIANWYSAGVRQFLLDSASPGFGGSGKSLDWSAAGQAISQWRATYPSIHFILAGGLNPANIAAAIAETHPDGVDVASGVENKPGVKSSLLVQQFVTAALQAFTEAQGEAQR